MCLDRGVKPSLMDFQTRVSLGNMRNLSIWHNIGADAEYGDWAILGARMGTYMTMLDNWDYTLVHDFDELHKVFNSEFADLEFNNRDLDFYGEQLRVKLGLDMLLEDVDWSRFFKKYSAVRKNKGIMVIDGQE
jgi:hypothetical protein